MEFLSSLNEVALLSDFGDFALLVPRVVFGVTFFSYGWPKLRDLKANAEDFKSMGFGFLGGWFFGTPIAILESIGSLMVLSGLFFGVVPLFFVAHMSTGTIWKITSTEKPFTDWSYDLLLLAISVLFLVTGPGSITLLALLGR
jgi:uncharacterized membrane protein YphA (DoxX/SURF4 family)